MIGRNGANMAKTVLRLAAGEGPLRFVDDQRGSPTLAADLAGKVVDLALSRRPGLFHVTNQGSTTWYGFAREVLRLAGDDPGRVEPIATRELDPPRPAPRPANSVLDNAALRLNGEPLLPDWAGRPRAPREDPPWLRPDCRLATAAVVVNYNAGRALLDCVASLEAEPVDDIVVVDNGSGDGSMAALAAACPAVRPILAGRNLGYGAAANLGARSTSAEYVIVCNPDLVAKPGAVKTLAAVLDDRSDVAVAGPMLREESGVVYPSGRDFPGMAEAIGHGFVGIFWGGNPWTRRYRRVGQEQHRAREADWVSGAFFLARRRALEEVGGFDERYFMYVEDVDLCWRLHRAGWAVQYEPAAEVVHEQGRSTSQHPYRMLLAHHRSMWRFATETTDGAERALLPLVAAGLVVRLGLAWGEHLVGARSRLRSRRD